MHLFDLDPVSLAVGGLAGLLLGVAELFLSRLRRQPTARLALALAAVFAAAAGAAAAAGLSAVWWQTALGLAAVELGLALLRAPLPFRLLQRPLLQGAALTVAAAGLVAGQMYRIDAGLELEMSRTDLEMSYLGDPVGVEGSPALVAQTDRGGRVPLFAPPPESSNPPDGVESRYLENQKLLMKLIQTAPADIQYNCHGWVFTGGRYWLRGRFIEGILKENGYRAVAPPRAGDVAVFRTPTGEVTHTGLVRGADPVLIESKWGRLGRFIHTPDEHAYRGHDVTYYRSERDGHLLIGLDGAPAPLARTP